MRSPAIAIAWGFFKRHRWGLSAVILYLLVLGTVRLLDLGPGRPRGSERFAFTVIMPLSFSFMYLMVVFCFGLAGDLAGRQSMYPARMFTLPVTTNALAGWPMLYGTVAMAGVWVAATLLTLWPSGINAPLIWPALFVAALLAWTQVLMWMSYGLPGLRVVVAVLFLVAICLILILGIHFKPAELLMVAILAPQLPIAFFIARAAVARARHGDVPDWQGRFVRRGQAAGASPRRRDHFPSPGSAQAWFEWRQHGRSLPVWVGILLPFELAFLFLGSNDTPAFILYVLLGVLLTPAFMATFAAPALFKPTSQASDSRDMTPFEAARPLTSTALIAAKLKVALWSTLATWLLVLVAIPLALALSGTWPAVIELARQLAEAVGTPRAVVVVLLAFWLLVASTWKQLVQSLYIGLSGREWLVRASLFLGLLLVTVIVGLVQWAREESGLRVTLWNAMPWILAVLVLLKMSAAAWIATRLYQSRLLGDRTLVAGAAGWLLAVLALYGLLVWFASTPLIPRYYLLLAAILAIPLARLSAAPLALAWNRHR